MAGIEEWGSGTWMSLCCCCASSSAGTGVASACQTSRLGKLRLYTADACHTLPGRCSERASAARTGRTSAQGLLRRAGQTCWAWNARQSIKVEGVLVAWRAERPFLLRALRAELHGERKCQFRYRHHRRNQSILINGGQCAADIQLIRVPNASCSSCVPDVRSAHLHLQHHCEQGA